MGESRYKKACELLKPIVGKTLHKNKIWRRIMIDIGSDERTLRDMMNLMISLGLIHEVKQDHYEILAAEADI